MKNVYELIEEILGKGKIPKISIFPHLEVPLQKRIGPGRPINYQIDPFNPFAHYATPRAGQGRPLCAWCKRRLKCKDIEVCCTECGHQYIEYAEAKINRIKGCKND